MEDKVIQINRVYDSKEAAELLGVHEETVREYCRLGIIKCKKLKGWKILGQDLIDFMTTDQPSGRKNG